MVVLVEVDATAGAFMVSDWRETTPDDNTRPVIVEPVLISTLPPSTIIPDIDTELPMVVWPITAQKTLL